MSHQAFELKASTYTLTILQLKTFDVGVIAEQLTATINRAPNFFNQTPVVLDLHRLQTIQCPIDFAALITMLKSHSLIPVGVTGANADQTSQAVAAGLGVISSQHADKSPLDTTAQTVGYATPEPASNDVQTAKIIDQPVRSGQKIYAKASDLIILSSVGHGAEVIADGNIHIYGTLRGRALAGASGNVHSRIFCHKFEAELVSIAGLYQLNDQYQSQLGLTHCQIFRNDDKLCVEQLS